jgi:hypothetical protein
MAVLNPLVLAHLPLYHGVLDAINRTRKQLRDTILCYADEMDNPGGVDGNQQFVSSFDSN